MFKKIVALLLGFQFLTFAAGATTTYKTCGLPDAVAIADTDHFELSRNCAGSYNATGAELSTYFLSKAPGSDSQIVFNSGGKFAAASASTVRAKLGLATVAASGAYSDLSGLPTIPAAQVSSDWNAVSGIAQILNKPSLGSLAALSAVNNANWSGTALSIANGGTGATTQGAAQTALALVPGTNVQAFSAELSGVAGLSSTGYVQRTGTGTYTAAATVPLGSVSGAGTAAAATLGTSGATLGYLNGNLTLSGSDTFSGTDTFTGTTLISKNAAALPTSLTGTLLQAGGANSTAARIEADAFAATAFFTAVRYDGTAASPTALQSGDEIGGFNFWGHNGTSAVGPMASFRAFANQTWTGTANGTYLDLATTPNGSTTLTSAGHVENDGGLTWPSTVTGGDKGAGTINATALYQSGVQVATGAASSTDATLPRFNGTSGKALQASNIAVTSNDEISGFRALVVTDATTARTLAASDRGTTIVFTNSSAITVTVPNSLSAGFNVTVIQGGAGQITFSAASGATLTNAHSQTKTYGQGAAVSLIVTGNSGGTSAAYILAGDTGA